MFYRPETMEIAKPWRRRPLAAKATINFGPNNKANGREPFGATLAPASGVTKGEASRSALGSAEPRSLLLSWLSRKTTRQTTHTTTAEAESKPNNTSERELDLQKALPPTH